MLLELVAIAALGGAWLAHGRGRPEPAARTRPRPPPSRFHAVTIVAGPAACARARRLARHDCATLPDDAPRLPLQGCDRERCECRYAHHADRRRRVRRAVDRGWPARGAGPGERRRLSDRRRDEP